jgi:outer membrane protein assembly factor BamB
MTRRSTAFWTAAVGLIACASSGSEPGTGIDPGKIAYDERDEAHSLVGDVAPSYLAARYGIRIPRDLDLAYAWHNDQLDSGVRSQASGRPCIWPINDVIVVELSNHKLVGIDRASGRTLFRTQLEKTIEGIPSVTKNNVYVTYDNYVIMIERASGRIVWQKQADLVNIGTNVIAIEPRVYAGALDRRLFAVDIQERDRVYFRDQKLDLIYQDKDYKLLSTWQRRTPESGRFMGPLLERGGLLYYATDNGYVMAFTLKGEEQSKFQAKGSILAPMAVSSRRLYAGASDFNLYALNRFTLKPDWTFRAQSDFYEPAYPDESSRVVYSPVHRKGTFALDAVDGRVLWNKADVAYIAGSGDKFVYLRMKNGELLCTEKRTGNVRSKSTLSDIADLAENHNQWNFTDEAFRLYAVMNGNLVALKERTYGFGAGRPAAAAMDAKAKGYQAVLGRWEIDWPASISLNADAKVKEDLETLRTTMFQRLFFQFTKEGRFEILAASSETAQPTPVDAGIYDVLAKDLTITMKGADNQDVVTKDVFSVQDNKIMTLKTGLDKVKLAAFMTRKVEQ